MKTWMALWMGLSVGAFGSSALADSQKAVDVQSFPDVPTIQKRIAEQHANWRAKESWVTRLSKEELHRMLGLQQPPKGSLDFEGIHAKNSKLPDALDWRNVKGVNWLGPVMNQGNCGSCVAFSTVATLEGQYSISAGGPWLRPTFSPQDLFACGGGGCETGWMPDNAAEFLKNTGITDEACMPYTSGSTGLDASCRTSCADAGPRTYRIAGYNTPTSYGGNMDDVKAALQKGPLVTTLLVYFDFITYAGGVYKHVAGDAAGGHAISLVGYDDTKRAWLIRNSWGTEWGENGFGWISYDDISGVGANTWGFNINSGAAELSVTSPSDSEYISGQYEVQVKNQGLKGQSVQVHIKDPNGNEVVTDCANSGTDSCSAQLSTRSMTEGRYEVYAAGGSVRSQVRQFYVINSEPKMSLSFTPVDGVDLNAPLNGRPEFNIQATFSPVPIQHLEFRVLDSSGKVAALKSNDNVLTQMKMGWRTVTVADGQYKILFHGETKYNGKVYSVDSNAYSVTVKN